MVLVKREVSGPGGIYDIQIVRFKGKDCFAASLGLEVRIFDENGEGVHTIMMDTCVKSIIRRGEYYVLLMANMSALFQDETMLRMRACPDVFDNAMYSMSIGDRLITICAPGYIVSDVTGTAIIPATDPNESVFYKIASATIADENTLEKHPWGMEAEHRPARGLCGKSVFALGRTASHMFILQFTTTVHVKTHMRCEFRECNTIFEYRGDLYTIKRDGLWRHTRVSNRVRVIGNYKVASTYYDRISDRILLFCTNGDVTELVGDELEPKFLCNLRCPITCAQRIGNTFFVGSKDYSYILTGELIVLRRFFGITSIRSMMITDDTIYGISYDELIKFESLIKTRRATDADFETRMDTVEAPEALQSSVPWDFNPPPYNEEMPAPIQLQGLFKTCEFRVLSYNKFSLVNGRPFLPIKAFYADDDCGIFVGSSAIYVVGTSVTTISTPFTYVMYAPGCLYIYYFDQVHKIDINRKTIVSSAADPSTYYIMRSGDSVYTISLDGTAHLVRFSTEARPLTAASQMTLDEFYGLGRDILDQECREFISKNGHHNTLMDRPLSFADSAVSDRYFVVAGHLYSFTDGVPVKMCAVRGHAHAVHEYKNGVLIECAEANYYYNVQADAFRKLDRRGTCLEFYVSAKNKPGDGEYLIISENNFYVVSSLVPTINQSITHIDVAPHEELIFADNTNRVTIIKSIDDLSFRIVLNKNPPVHHANLFPVAYCVINETRLAFSVYNSAEHTPYLLIYRIHRKKLHLQKKLVIGGVALAIASYRNRLALVLQHTIAIYELRNGRIRETKKHYDSANEYIVEALYSTSGIFMARGTDWTIRVLYPNDEFIQTTFIRNSRPTPVVINGKHGWCSSRILHWQKQTTFFGEHIANAFSMGSGAILITESGRTIYLREHEHALKITQFASHGCLDWDRADPVMKQNLLYFMG